MSYCALMLAGLLRASICCVLLAVVWPARVDAMSCTVLSSASVRYGTYEAFSAIPLDSAGAISFRCTSVIDGDLVSLQLGRDGSGRFIPRAMRGGDARLEYNLFLDAARSIVWGDGTSGTSAYTVHPADGQTVSVPVYGRVWPRQNVPAGTYDDVVVLTVLY